MGNDSNIPRLKAGVFIIDKISQLLKEKEKIDYDIVSDIATEVFENITANIFETTIFDSHVIKDNLIDFSINVLGSGFNGKVIQTDNGFKIIIGNISKHLNDHQRLFKFIYSILVHEITHISDILNDKYLDEEPEDLKEYVNSENERIAYMNQIIRECISYMNDLSPKLLAERIKLNDGKNDFIVNEILKYSETFMELKNIINSSFISQLRKSIKYLLYKFTKI